MAVIKMMRAVARQLTRFSVVAALLLAAAPAQARVMPSLITLYEGESKVVTARGAARIAVGQTKILSAALLKNGELVLTADGVGETNMQVWFSDDRREEVAVVVVESNGWREISEIRALLEDIAGIRIRGIGRRVVVEGNLLQRDLDRVNLVKQRYPNMLILAQPISEFGQKMIYFDVQVTEFNKDEVEELGINWSTSIAGPTLAYGRGWRQRGPVAPNLSGGSSTAAFDDWDTAGSPGGVFFGIASEITSRINFMQKSGAAIVLASPRLSARSGGTAELTVGGQVPVVTSTINGPSVEYKDFGVLLQIQPVLDPYGNIVARVSTEISQLDKANEVQGYPAFRTRRTDNDIKLRDAETLVLSGLITREDQYSYDKVKYLGDLPVIGQLFRSKSFKGGSTELVIFITPRVMESAQDQLNREEVSRAAAMVEDFEKRMGSGIWE